MIQNIHTGIFQGKIKNFPGLETPQVRSSDPTVQYSVGPMVHFYTRYVPILRTLFITELRGSRSSGLTCQKKVKNFPGEKLSRAKLSRAKLSRGNFPGRKLSRGETFQGKTFQGKGKAEKDTPKAFAGDARCNEDRYPWSRRGPLEVLDRLGRPESCGFQGVILGIYGVVTARLQRQTCDNYVASWRAAGWADSGGG